MIIYPLVIIGLMLVAFVIIFRRAYLTEKEIPQKAIDRIVAQDEVSQQASQDFYEKQEYDPNFKKAEELFKKKQYISAEKWYIEAVQKDPKNFKIYSRLGLIYLEQRNYKDAIDSFNEAIKLEPSLASQYFNLSYALNQEGDKKESINNAKRAIRIEPNNKKYKKWLDEIRSNPF